MGHRFNAYDHLRSRKRHNDLSNASIPGRTGLQEVSRNKIRHVCTPGVCHVEKTIGALLPCLRTKAVGHIGRAECDKRYRRAKALIGDRFDTNTIEGPEDAHRRGVYSYCRQGANNPLNA